MKTTVISLKNDPKNKVIHILWNKFSKKSRSLSPSPKKNTLFPSIKALQNQNKTQIVPESIIKSNKTFFDSLENINVSSNYKETVNEISQFCQKIDKKLKNFNIDTQTKLIEEHPLYNNKNKLSKKENIKENQIKIFQLVGLLNEEKKNNNNISKKKALICQKILEILKR